MGTLPVLRCVGGRAVTVPEETYRGTLKGRTAIGEPTTIIVTRKGLGRDGRVWLTLHGALKTTVTMSDEETGGLVALLDAARGPR